MNPMFSGGPIAHPEIPIWLAGVNPGICRAAGGGADGFHVYPMHSLSYLRKVVFPEIEKAAERAGRSARTIELDSPLFAVSGDLRS